MHPESVVLESSVNPSFGCINQQPMLGLTDDIEKYLTESCSGGANNRFFLNLFIKCSSTFDEQIQEKLI